MTANEAKPDPGTPGLFNGVYSYQEAAQILHVSTQRVKRWADGYTFRLKQGRVGSSAPILQTERRRGVVSFDELFELMFVREYVGLNILLPHIRDTAEALSAEFGPLPFSTAALIINGRELIIRTADTVLQRPDVGQMVADFAGNLAKSVEFRDRLAARYSIPEHKRIYLDRDIRAGEAVVTQYAIPTRTIYGLWEKEKNLKRVAEYHDISIVDVKAAVRYEGQWRLAA